MKGIGKMKFSEVLPQMLEKAAKDACNDIGYPYDEGVLEQIIMDVDHHIEKHGRPTRLDMIGFAIDEAITKWKENTEENYMDDEGNPVY